MAWNGEKKRMAWEQLEETRRQTFRRLFEFKIPLLSNLKFQSACLLAAFLELILTFFEKRHQQYRAAIVYGSFVLLVSQWNCKRNDKNEYFVFEFYECVLDVCVYNNRRLCLNAAPKSGRDPQYLKKSNENLRVVLIGYSLRLYFYKDDFLFV